MYGITAASGCLGQLVVEELSKLVSPSEIVLIVRNLKKLEYLKGRGFLIRKADYIDKQSMEKALVGIDTLLLISGTAIGERIKQHRNVIEAAQLNHVEKILYTSFPMRFPPKSPLVQDHSQTEDLIMNSGLNYAILRNTFYAEVLLENLSLILDRGEFVSLASKGGVPYISRTDIALAAVNVVISDQFNNQVFELTGSDIINNKRFVE